MGTSTSYIAPTSGDWPQAKRLATRFAKQGGTDGGSLTPGQVVSGYVKAHGGSTSATTSATAARAMAGGLAGFFGAVATRGLVGALRQFGLSQLIGQSRTDILIQLVDVLAGSGRTLEEAAARAAMITVLQNEFGEGEAFGDIEAHLSGKLDVQGVQQTLQSFLSEYVYRRMVEELGDRLLSGALTGKDTCRVEKDLHSYIIAATHFEFELTDPTTIDWGGPEGQKIIEQLLLGAYTQLEISTSA